MSHTASQNTSVPGLLAHSGDHVSWLDLKAHLDTLPSLERGDFVTTFHHHLIQNRHRDDYYAAQLAKHCYQHEEALL